MFQANIRELFSNLRIIFHFNDQLIINQMKLAFDIKDDDDELIQLFKDVDYDAFFKLLKHKILKETGKTVEVLKLVDYLNSYAYRAFRNKQFEESSFLFKHIIYVIQLLNTLKLKEQQTVAVSRTRLLANLSSKNFIKAFVLFFVAFFCGILLGKKVFPVTPVDAYETCRQASLEFTKENPLCAVEEPN